MVGVEAELGVCVPGGEEEKEVENMLLVLSWEETFDRRDNALYTDCKTAI